MPNIQKQNPKMNSPLTFIKLTLNDCCKQSIIKSGEKAQRIIAEDGFRKEFVII